jgi:hypothetical protein
LESAPSLIQIRVPIYQKYSHEWIEPTIEMLMTLRFPSGNYPSSIGSASGDKLVHWCHGAPGWVAPFCMAHKVINDYPILTSVFILYLTFFFRLTEIRNISTML